MYISVFNFPLFHVILNEFSCQNVFDSVYVQGRGDRRVNCCTKYNGLTAFPKLAARDTDFICVPWSSGTVVSGVRSTGKGENGALLDEFSLLHCRGVGLWEMTHWSSAKGFFIVTQFTPLANQFPYAKTYLSSPKRQCQCEFQSHRTSQLAESLSKQVLDRLWTFRKLSDFQTNKRSWAEKVAVSEGRARC